MQDATWCYARVRLQAVLPIWKMDMLLNSEWDNLNKPMRSSSFRCRTEILFFSEPNRRISVPDTRITCVIQLESMIFCEFSNFVFSCIFRAEARTSTSGAACSGPRTLFWSMFHQHQSSNVKSHYLFTKPLLYNGTICYLTYKSNPFFIYLQQSLT